MSGSVGPWGHKVTLAVVLLISVSSCGLLKLDGERADLASALERAAGALEQGALLDIRTITDFTWGRLIILPSYATNDVAEEALGFEWEAERLPTYSTDILTAIVFASEDKVVAWTVLDNSRIDFPPNLQARAVEIPREEGIFRVTRRDGVIVLEPAANP